MCSDPKLVSMWSQFPCDIDDCCSACKTMTVLDVMLSHLVLSDCLQYTVPSRTSTEAIFYEPTPWYWETIGHSACCWCGLWLLIVLAILAVWGTGLISSFTRLKSHFLACVLMIDSVMPFRSGFAHGGHSTPFYLLTYLLTTHFTAWHRSKVKHC